MSTTYKINRFYQEDFPDTEVVATGLTLEQAQAHCSDPSTSSSTCGDAKGLERTQMFGPWFEGYESEA